MQILTVSQLNRYIKDKLDNDYLLTNVWIKGEISNCKKHTSGHIYLTLKDDASCIRVVMFRSRACRLLFSPENGATVTIRGYVSVYERDGSYQLYAEEMEPAGIGALYLAFEQLKQKLQQEGLFDQSRKRKLPKIPTTIGIITSPTGAAVKDMIKIIGNRWPAAQLVIVPVLVQGENAPQDISRGIEEINQVPDVDVIIVGRGGGSLEELWAFNTEAVARAIAASKVPVISAVGHETDTTICDYVADIRAATPSAAAEMAVPDQREVKRYLQMLAIRSERAIRQYIEQNHLKLKRIQQSNVLLNPQRMIIDTRQQHVDMLLRELLHKEKYLISQKGKLLGELAAALQSLSPLATLARGYSLCIGPDDQIIKATEQVRIGSKVQVILHQGSLSCTVNAKQDNNNLI
ncbi:exodeoxyribonuclease VII large subunit [Peptococcaceae bacterium 1198_IL3148]